MFDLKSPYLGSPKAVLVPVPSDYKSPYPAWMVVGLKPMLDTSDGSVWWVPK